MIKLKPTNNCYIKVFPRNAGNFGIFRMSGIERTPEEEYELCKEIEKDIKRHVDNIEYTYIDRGYVYVGNNDNEYDNLYEALEDLYAPEEYVRGFTYRYENPFDNGVGTQGRVYDFKDLIINAYNKPWKFTVTGDLTDLEKEFLNNVIKAGLEAKSQK